MESIKMESIGDKKTKQNEPKWKKLSHWMFHKMLFCFNKLKQVDKNTKLVIKNKQQQYKQKRCNLFVLKRWY